MRRTGSAALIAALMMVGSAAQAQTASPTVAAQAAARPVATPGGDRGDPFEGANRAFFAINRFLDRVLIRPVSVFYKRATPRPIRDGVHNFISNLGEPVVFLNDVLQVHPKKAGTTFGRFALNTTIGIGGIFDVATGAGAPHHDNGFGTTLGRYHTPPGPYLFIPVLGPSSIRDAIGSVVDTVSDPLFWARYPYDTESGVARTIVGGLDVRSRADKDLKTLYDSATDPYASLRSVYLQNRESDIQGGKVNLNALPDFGPDPAQIPPATPVAQPSAEPGSPAETATPPLAETDATAPEPATPPAEATSPPSTDTPPPVAAPDQGSDQAEVYSSHQIWTRSAGAM